MQTGARRKRGIQGNGRKKPQKAFAVLHRLAKWRDRAWLSGGMGLEFGSGNATAVVRHEQQAYALAYTLVSYLLRNSVTNNHRNER